MLRSGSTPNALPAAPTEGKMAMMTDSTSEDSEGQTTLDVRSRAGANSRTDSDPPTPDPDSPSGQPLDLQFELAWILRKLQLTDEALRIQADVEGRFEIRGLLGRGGMGAVYRAFDNLLGRDVALKVVSAAKSGREHMQQRLLQEARAMARVEHENVVRIHDVRAAVSGEYVIAIEFIEGSTLREWQENRPFREILPVYLAAARGLQAAHEADVVHRDFKPDNVFVRSEQARLRVAVGDFGLAAGILGTEVMDRPLRPATSTRLGTLAYMAPEQHRYPATIQSDQYAFCVSLWEALAGERPFPEIRTRFDEVPFSHPCIPGWLCRILRRGLAWNTHDRFPDMASLIEQIERGMSWQANRYRLFAAGAAVLLGLMAFLSFRPMPCERELARVETVWNADAEHDVRAAFDRLDATWSEPARDHAIATLDEAASAWRARAMSICEAPPDARHERERECLDDWLEQIEQSVDRLRAGDLDYIEHLVDVLVPLAAGDDSCQFPGKVVDPRIRRLLREAELAEHERMLATAKARSIEATELAAALPSCMEGTGYSSASALAFYRLGHVYGEMEEWDAALGALRSAASHAIACDDQPLLFDIRAHETLMFALAPRAMTQRGRASLADAEAVLARIVPTHTTTLRNVERLRVRGLLEAAEQDFDGAVADFEQSLALLAQLDAPPLARVVQVHHNMGSTLQFAGRYEEAEQAHRRAWSLLAERVGESHPQARASRPGIDVNAGLLALARGEQARADELLSSAAEQGDAVVAARAYAALLELRMQQTDVGMDARLPETARAALAWLEQQPHVAQLARAELLANIGQAQAESAFDAEGELHDPPSFDEGIGRLRETFVILDAVDPVQSGIARYIAAELLVRCGRGEEAKPLLEAIRADSAAMANTELAEALVELDAQLVAPSEPDDRDTLGP